MIRAKAKKLKQRARAKKSLEQKHKKVQKNLELKQKKNEMHVTYILPLNNRIILFILCKFGEALIKFVRQGQTLVHRVFRICRNFYLR